MRSSDDAARRTARLLVRAFPARFRRALGDDLVDTVAARYRERDRGRVAFWVRTSASILAAALAERVSPTTSAQFASTEAIRRSTSPFRRIGEEFSHAVRAAARALTRTPAFCAVAASILALGIGGAVLVFSVVRATLLAPLPYPDEHRLVQLFEVERETDSGRINDRMYFAWGNYADVRDRATAFERVAAWQYYDYTLSGREAAVRLRGRRVTADFFSTLGIRPVLGRALSREDELLGAEPVAVVAHHVWRTHLHEASPGRTILLDGIPHTLIGVMPQGFDFPYDGELWVPLRPFLGENAVGLRRFHRYRVIGRLRRDATVAHAREQLAAIATQIERENPETNRENGFTAEGLRSTLTGDVRPVLMTALAASVAFLLAACANVSGLLAARFAARAREFSLRAALGARRTRLALHALAECLLLCLLGGMAAAMLVAWALPIVAAALSAAMPRLAGLETDPGIVAFAAAVTLLTGVAAGCVPAWRASRQDPGLALKTASRSSTDAGSRRARDVLVVAQFAVALCLAANAGLLLRSVDQLSKIETNVEVDGVVAIDVALPEGSYRSDRALRFYQELVSTLEARPDVQRAAAALVAPLTGAGWGNRLYREGVSLAEPEIPIVGYQIVTAGFFETAGIPVTAGRAFVGTDNERRVVVISRYTAARLWPDRSPLGAQIRFSPTGDPATVVGLAADVPARIGEPVGLQVYVSPAVESVLSMTILARNPGGTLRAGDVRAIVRQLDPGVPVIAVEPLASRAGESLLRPRLISRVVSVFAVLALLLALAGVAAALVYQVSSRTREYGIRLALGASPSGMMWSTMRYGLRLAALGTGVGFVLSLASARWLREMLFEVTPADPRTYAAVAVLVGMAALAAAALPARRVTRVDPLTALREE